MLTPSMSNASPKTMAAQRSLQRAFVGTIGAYVFLLAALLTWHCYQGPPYERATPALLVAMGLCVALVSLLSIWGALVTLHWPKRVSGFVIGAAVLSGVLLGIFDWPAYFLWQLVVELLIAMVFQLVALGGLRLVGYD